MLYLLVCVFTIKKSFQISPFYNWSMYSGAVSQPAEYSFTEIYCDSTLINQPHTYNDYGRMMLTYTSRHYLLLIDTNHITTRYDHLNSALTKIGFNGNYVAEQLTVTDSVIEVYPTWLKRYVRKNIMSDFDSLRLYNVVVRYDSNANIQLVNRQLIFTQ